VLDAQVRLSNRLILEEPQKHHLLGFGPAIDTGKNYRELIDFADKLPQFTK
jgi:hypothetical protein